MLLQMYIVQCKWYGKKVVVVFYNRFTAHLDLGFNTLFVQYYSVICRPSDHTVGRPRAEIRTRVQCLSNLIKQTYYIKTLPHTSVQTKKEDAFG